MDVGDLPIELVDTAAIPGGGQLLLRRRGDDFAIEYGESQLMVSWASRSERALATLTCQRVVGDSPHMLVGGLGMGFTLAAALAALPRGASIIVAELVPTVVDWARGALAHLFGDALEDPRVSVEVCDVHDLIAGSVETFDAILLDVDNGPSGLISAVNDRLYSEEGLRASYTALRRGGILAIWSGYADYSFTGKLEDVGFVVEEVSLRTGENGQGDRHMIWLATRERA